MKIYFVGNLEGKKAYLEEGQMNDCHQEWLNEEPLTKKQIEDQLRSKGETEMIKKIKKIPDHYVGTYCIGCCDAGCSSLYFFYDKEIL